MDEFPLDKPVYYTNVDKMAQMPTIKQRIDLAVKQAEERLAKAKRAKEILSNNPELEELLNIMQQSHF